MKKEQCCLCHKSLNVINKLCFSCATQIAKETDEEREHMYRYRNMNDPHAIKKIHEWKHPKMLIVLQERVK